MMKSLGYDAKRVATMYRIYDHPSLGKTVVDPVFECYRNVYVGLAKQMKVSGIRIVNASENGCLVTPETEIMSFREYLDSI
jgi:hypothetical protein